MRRLGIAFAWVALALSPASAGSDPKVPIGQDPGGTAVAFLTTGLDYRMPEVARVLARDGEGEIIAWDFADGDQRPFASDGDGTAMAVTLARAGRVRFVPVRVSLADPASLARAVAFIARTPARIVVVAMESESEAQWEGFAAAARHFKTLTFIVASREGVGFPAGLKLDNALSVASATGGKADAVIEAATPVEAAAAVLKMVVCSGDLVALEGAEMRLALAQQLSGAPTNAGPDSGAVAPGCPEQDAR